MMPLGVIWFCWQRRRLAQRLPDNPLRVYLQGEMPAPHLDCRDIPYLALDLETTGLNPNKDQILSMGWVAMDGLTIQLRTARQQWVRPTQAIPEASAIVHGIGDDRAARGDSLRHAMAQLLEALHGRILLAHHASIELGFLDQASRALYGQPCWIPAVDTLHIEQQNLQRRQEMPRSGGLRLNALRARYNLPRYRGHDALTDALAAAELFAAQMAHRLQDQESLPLKRMLYRPASLW